MENSQSAIEHTDSQNELHFLQTVLNSLPALIYINELECQNDPSSIKNVYVNQFGLDFVGYTRAEIDEMGSQFFQKVIHPDDLNVIPETIDVSRNYQKELFMTSMHRLKRRDCNDYHWFYDHGINLETFPDGSPRKSLVVSVEVTSTISTQKQLNAALKQISQLKYALKLSSLTVREKQILHLIVKGKTDKEISAELYISIQTAKKHRHNLIQKTGVCNTAELVALAVESGECDS